MVGTKKQSILVVDDDPEVLSIVETFFRKSCHAVHTASNGMEALDIMTVSGNDIELVVTDVEMPLLHGPGLASELGRKWPRLPILFISGRPREDIETVPPLPIEATFLQKPFSLKELERLVQHILGANSPEESREPPHSEPIVAVKP